MTLTLSMHMKKTSYKMTNKTNYDAVENTIPEK